MLFQIRLCLLSDPNPLQYCSMQVSSGEIRIRDAVMGDRTACVFIAAKPGVCDDSMKNSKFTMYGLATTALFAC